MLATQIMTAIADAPLRALDDLSRDIWKAFGVSMISEDQAQALAQAIHDRRHQLRNRDTSGTGRTTTGNTRTWSYFPPKRSQRSPDRQRSLERRRQLAASGPLPQQLAAKFTTGEQAVLRIIGDAVRDHGDCRLTVPEIAARSGTSETTVRRALKEASSLGLITIEERRVPYQPNRPNVVRIVSKEWLDWIRRGGGFQKRKATENQGFQKKKPFPSRSDEQVPQQGVYRHASILLRCS
jgi:AraC-like DNA-binding protein